MKPDPLMPREAVPSLDLPLTNGERFTLGAAPGAAFDLLVFYRGLHCPICTKYLLELERLEPEFRKRGVQVVAISSDGEERARQMAEELNLPLSKEDISAKYVFSAARDGEHWACKIVDETIDYLTICLANISALINPQLIVLTGGLMGSADLLLDPIQRRLEGLMPAVPRLAVSSLGPRATVMGATLFVLTAATGSHAVRQLP